MKTNPITETVYFPMFKGHIPPSFLGHSPIGGTFKHDVPMPRPLPIVGQPEKDTFQRTK